MSDYVCKGAECVCVCVSEPTSKYEELVTRLHLHVRMYCGGMCASELYTVSSS